MAFFGVLPNVTQSVGIIIIVISNVGLIVYDKKLERDADRK